MVGGQLRRSFRLINAFSEQTLIVLGRDCMFFLLFGFWVLLNGKWTMEIGIVGLIVCAALYAFMCAFMGYSPRQEWRVLRRLPRIIGYILYLVKEIFASAYATMKLIWSPREEIQPRVTSFHTRLRTDAGKVVLANSITMTPGTITVDVEGDLFLIHCLDETFDVGQEGFDMENRIMQIEGPARTAAPETAAKEEHQDE